MPPSSIIGAKTVQRERTWREVFAASGLLAIVCISAIEIATHVVAPLLLTHFDHFPALEAAPKRTSSPSGVPADPVNVALVGTQADVALAMRSAGWTLADSLSRASDIAIAKSVLLNRPDSSAPVSSQLLFGRRQDLAYEQQVGPSARRRHHVRLWLDRRVAYEGRPVWIGTATFDRAAGISHRALRPTHHIAPDVDEERDILVAALARAGRLNARFRVTGMGIRVDERNADGDRFDTDGELQVAVIAPDGQVHDAPIDAPDPALVQLKDKLWRWVHRR